MQEQINNLWISNIFWRIFKRNFKRKDWKIETWRKMCRIDVRDDEGTDPGRGEGGISREMKMKNTVCGFFAVKNERTSVGSINLIECSWIMGGTVKNNSAVKEQPGWTRRATLSSLSLLDEYGDGIEPTRVIFIPFIMLLIRNRDGIADNRCTVTGMSVNFSGISFHRLFVIH